MGWLAAACALLFVAAAIALVDRAKRRRDMAQKTLAGMRYVLSDDPDAAIEALSDAARLGTPESVETYLALGALFRRTGDLTRAIRLHRNLLMSPRLEASRRTEVERELAGDYRRAGQLDAAVELYRKLGDDPQALAGLRDALAEKGDLAGAVEAQRRLGPSGARVLGHMLAALARGRAAKDPDGALAAAREAVAAAPESADARLALAEAQARRGQEGEALAAVADALDTEPSAAELAWPALAALPDRGAAQRFLAERASARPADAGVKLLEARLWREQGRGEEALGALRRALELDQSGEVAAAVPALLQQPGAPPAGELAARHELLVRALERPARPLRCRACGAETPVRAWRCTHCGAFDALAR